MNEQDELPKPANGWLVASDKNSFPDFTVELLEKYGGWLLDNFKKGSLAHAQAAINYYYAKAGIKSPWLGREFCRASTKYAEARFELMVENGEFVSGQDPLGSRVAVHEDILLWILEFGESLAMNDPRRSKISIILIGYLFLLRASSLFFEEGDVRFIRDADGKIASLIVDSTCVKTLAKGKKHQRRCPAPREAFGPGHPRARIFAMVESALEFGDIFSIVSSSGSAAATVSKWMIDLIPADISALIEGTKITSHSLRKAGASAMVALLIDLKTRVMPWGRWKSISSAEKYIDEAYYVTSFSGGCFGWFMPAGATFEWIPVE